MNSNQTNRFSNDVQPNFEWWTATQHDVNYGNFMADFSVQPHDMNVPPSPNLPPSPSRVQNIRCAAPQAPAWEYKIGIAPANTSDGGKNVQELFLKVLGKRGWIFVSENQGIFHFKRPKQ